MLREDHPLASAQDFDVPTCAAGVDDAVALLRAARDVWLRAQE
jgi:hypothetical protein